MALILIIDDEEDTRKMVEEILEIDDHKVYSAENWSAGIPVLTNQKIDMLLLDLNMPGIKGDRVVDILWQTVERVPRIVFYSGRDEAELQRMAREYQVDGYIQKGVNASEFLRKIRDFLRKS